jgi:hypothetical protein
MTKAKSELWLITAKEAYQYIGCDNRHFERVYKDKLTPHFQDGAVKPRYDRAEVVKLDKKCPYKKAVKHQKVAQ